MFVDEYEFDQDSGCGFTKSSRARHHRDVRNIGSDGAARIRMRRGESGLLPRYREVAAFWSIVDGMRVRADDRHSQ